MCFDLLLSIPHSKIATLANILKYSIFTVPSAAPATTAGHVINSTSVLLLWEPLPEDKQNGDIIYYTLVLSGNENHDYLISYNFTINSTLIELSTLKPFSEYNVSIAANTVIGMGPFTAPYTFYTPEDGMV